MGKRLQDNLNSDYIASANRLKPKNSRRRIVAYVESYDDVFFWRSVLQEFETDKLYFEVMLPSRTNLGKGKKKALMNRLGPSLGECMIACVDADYDWLMQGKTEVSKLICNNPYVIHTYVYAIENYQCYAPSLHSSCVMSTLNDRQILDFVAYMKEFSEFIWPLLVWNVWCCRHDVYNSFTITDFVDTVSSREVNVYHPERTLEYIRRKVNHKIAWLQRKFVKAKESYAPLREELLQMGLTPDTAYLYMQGHGLFSGVVMPLLMPVCAILRKEREREINNLSCHSVQRQNELASYQHSQGPIEDMLRKSSGFRSCGPYQWVREDIMRLIADVGLQK